jgi:hypothetical protein
MPLGTFCLADQFIEPMTKLSDLGPLIRGARYMGQPANEQENFFTCPACGQTVDARDLRQVMWHEKPGHRQLELDDDDARKEDAHRLLVLLGLVLVVAIFAYVAGIGI